MSMSVWFSLAANKNKEYIIRQVVYLSFKNYNICDGSSLLVA
jgi:hypothetical protein